MGGHYDDNGRCLSFPFSNDGVIFPFFFTQSSFSSDNGKGGCYDNIVMKEKKKKKRK
jgi:hypothetical protein